MQLHQIQPKNKNKSKKRVGRGGKRGTYSGRGLKGQKSRAGRRMRPELRDIIKKIPTKRGYKFSSIKDKPETVNLSVLDEKIEDGAQITPSILVEKKLINKRGRFLPKVKILGTGDITKKINISDCAVSKTAKEKIEKAGGQIV